ncbi:hypothetical protein E3983_00300 [Legionella israelensis]|uniref:Outer membrane protein beta-barrel domain-containing protein n=1 Tax=Legionella israelensis TaxID=454 RepID=A0AAX1EDJ6_9GAMM|nr:hypothetical protein [Legionella israelensis]QBR82932.1 hypothetical protein E3983_00300 [Legionella israelensis]
MAPQLQRIQPIINLIVGILILLYYLSIRISVLSGTGGAGEVYLGYKYSFFYRYSVALEGFYNRSFNSASFNLLDTNTLYSRQLTGSFKQKWLAGIVLRPGVYFTSKSLFYGRVGWIKSEVTLDGNIIQNGVAPYGSFSGDLNRPVDLNGIQLGLGMELQIIPRLNLRLEWDWNRVQDYVFNNVIRDSMGNPFAIFRTASHPTLEQIKLGLNWCFG